MDRPATFTGRINSSFVTILNCLCLFILIGCHPQERIDLMDLLPQAEEKLNASEPSAIVGQALQSGVCNLIYSASTAESAELLDNQRILHFTLPFPAKIWSPRRRPDEFEVKANDAELAYVSPQHIANATAGCWSLQGRSLTITESSGASLSYEVQYKPDPSVLKLYKCFYNGWLNESTKETILSPLQCNRYQASGLALSPGSHLSFPVELTGDAVLGFSIACEALDPAYPAANLRFSVILESNEMPLTLFSRTYDTDPWGLLKPIGVQVPIPQKVKGPVQFTLLVEQTAGNPAIGYWLSPTIYSSSKRGQTKPNIVLVTVSSLRADHVSFMGYRRPTTLKLDDVASQSVVFERAYATDSWSMPSHASLLTGLLPSHHGATRSVTRLSDEQKTLAEILRENGYMTIAQTSQEFLAPGRGFEQGFEQYGYVKNCQAGLAVDQAIEWIQAWRNVPFFFFLNLNDPEMDYQPPSPFNEYFEQNNESKMTGRAVDIYAALNSGQLLPEHDRRRIEALYDGEIAYVDQELDRFVEWLNTEKLFDNTVFLFTSDHGEEFFEHGSVGHGTTLYEEQMHVPLFISWPKGLKPRRIEEPVSAVDLVPTLLDLLRINSPKVDGLSLNGLMQKEKKTNRGMVTAEHEELDQFFQAGWSYPDKIILGPQRMLFDLRDQPLETRNLALQFPDLADSLESELRKIHDQARYPVFQVYIKSPPESDHEAYVHVKLSAELGPVFNRYQEPGDSLRISDKVFEVEGSYDLPRNDIDDVTIWLSGPGTGVNVQWEYTPSLRTPVPVHLGKQTNYVTSGQLSLTPEALLSSENARCAALDQPGTWGVFIVSEQKTGRRFTEISEPGMGSMSQEERALLEQLDHSNP